MKIVSPIPFHWTLAQFKIAHGSPKIHSGAGIGLKIIVARLMSNLHVPKHVRHAEKQNFATMINSSNSNQIIQRSGNSADGSLRIGKVRIIGGNSIAIKRRGLHGCVPNRVAFAQIQFLEKARFNRGRWESQEQTKKHHRTSRNVSIKMNLNR